MNKKEEKSLCLCKIRKHTTDFSKVTDNTSRIKIEYKVKLELEIKSGIMQGDGLNVL